MKFFKKTSQKKVAMQKKTIIEIFKSREQDFAQMPPAGAWEKLEKKLDRREKGAPIVRMPYWSVAASVVLLAGFFVLTLRWLSGQEQRPLFASGDARPQDLEFLIAEDAAENYARSLGQMKIYREKLALLYNDDTQNDGVENIAAAQAEKSKLFSKNKTIPAVTADQETMAMVESVPAPSPAAEKYDRRAMNTTLENLENEAFNPPVAGAMSAEKSSVTDLGKSSIRSFSWLLGAWEQQLPLGKSVENWVWQDSNTISGKGFLLQGDDTVFTEKMQLKQVGGQVVLYQAVEQGSDQVPFYLTEKSDSQWIFESDRQYFPNAVVLTKKDSARYESQITGAKNAKKDSRLSPDQELFLNQRNAIFYSNASRNMKRVRK